MRVTNFHPTALDTAALGLSPIAMSRLEQVVVLAGRNGSGKTRMLRVLQTTIGRLASASRPAVFDGGARSSRAPTIAEIQRSTLNGRPALAKYVDFSPSSSEILDPADLSRKKRSAGHSDVTRTLGMKAVSASVYTYIDHVAAQYFTTTHPETVTTNEGRTSECTNAWISLKKMVESVLPGAGLARDAEENVVIFNRPIGGSGLSAGQRVLLRVAVALHAQSVKLDEAILILDEPENHLHPDALVEFVDRLIKAIPNGQIWIATHSIHVLSFVNPKSLWFVEDGKICWAGGKPERVLRSLVGDEERVGRLESFIRLPSILAMERFAAECLLPPDIATTGAEDPQSKQIHEIITGYSAEKLRILDYGAGRGRILATLQQNTEDLKSRIDYHAFELNKDVRPDCVGAVADAYGLDHAAAEKRVYEDENALRERLNRESVDVVLMCNVLHEIPPSEWRSHFAEKVLSYCLKPTGYLLLLEDMRIPYGEKAHKFGFILLDTEQLKTLFAVDPEDRDRFRSFAKNGGRLKAHLVRADALKQVTDETVKRALWRRMESAGEEIQRLRSEPPTFANGHLLALYTMLYANAALALK